MAHSPWRFAALGLLLGSVLGAQETANVARLRRQCVVSPRLRPDVAAYQITWGTVKFERFTRQGGDDYYTQLCYPKQWMAKAAEPARRAAALYAGVWRIPKGKRIATLEHFVFQDQGQVRPPQLLRTPIGSVWYLPAPCICASKIHLDSYFLMQNRKLRRLDAETWERELQLPEGTSRAETPQLDLVAMKGRVKLAPSGTLQSSLRLEGARLVVERTELVPR